MELKITEKEKQLLSILMNQTTGDITNNPECWAKEFKTEIVTLNMKLACVGKEPLYKIGDCNLAVVSNSEAAVCPNCGCSDIYESKNTSACFCDYCSHRWAN